MTCQAFVWPCLAITRMSSVWQFPKWMLWRNNAWLSLLLQLSCHTGGCAPILTSLERLCPSRHTLSTSTSCWYWSMTNIAVYAGAGPTWCWHAVNNVAQQLLHTLELLIAIAIVTAILLSLSYMAYTVVIYPHGRLPLQSAFNYNKVQQRRKICSGKSLCIRDHLNKQSNLIASAHAWLQIF